MQHGGSSRLPALHLGSFYFSRSAVTEHGRKQHHAWLLIAEPGAYQCVGERQALQCVSEHHPEQHTARAASSQVTFYTSTTRRTDS